MRLVSVSFRSLRYHCTHSQRSYKIDNLARLNGTSRWVDSDHKVVQRNRRQAREHHRQFIANRVHKQVPWTYIGVNATRIHNASKQTHTSTKRRLVSLHPPWYHIKQNTSHTLPPSPNKKLAHLSLLLSHNSSFASASFASASFACSLTLTSPFSSISAPSLDPPIGSLMLSWVTPSIAINSVVKTKVDLAGMTGGRPCSP